MSRSAVLTGSGIHLAFGDGASPTEAFTDFAETLDINRTMSGETVEATHTDSPTMPVSLIPTKEYITAHIEPGEYTFQANLVPSDPTMDELTGAEALLNVEQNYSLRDVPNSTKEYIFLGAITNIGDAYPLQDKMVRDLTVKVLTVGAWSVQV